MPELAELDTLITRVVQAAERLRFDDGHECPRTLQELWDEICRFQTIVSYGAQVFPNFHHFEHQDAAQSVVFIRSAHNTFLQIENAIGAILRTSSQIFDVARVPDHQVLQEYCERLRTNRLALTSALVRLQSDQVRRMVMCMNDPEILGFCHQVNNGSSENTHIAYDASADANDISTMELAGGELESEVPADSPLKTHDSRRLKTWTYFGRLLRGQCSKSCQCKCHTPTSHACPNGFRQVIQRMFPRLNRDLFLINQCSKISCRNSNARRGQVSVVVHSELMKKAILFCVISRGLKFKFYIRDRPIVSDTSNGPIFAEIGDVIGMKKLFRDGKASVHDITSDGWSYLHTSTFHGRTELVRFLLIEGADPDDAEMKLRKASHFAKFRALTVGASVEEKALARLFPNEQDFRDDYQLSPILTALLREYDSSDLEKPTLETVVEFAKEAMDLFPDKNWEAWMREYQGRSPLYWEIIRSMQTSTADGNSCSSGFLRLLEKPDALQGWKPLQWAAFIGRLDDLKLLLINKADPFAITTSGRNLIHQAAETGAVEILEYLLGTNLHEQGLNISLPDIWGETPLHNAAAKSPAGVKLLVKYHADTEARQARGQVPLHYARYLKGKERIEVLTALLDQGGLQIDARDETGRSPIFYFLDSLESVSLLLEHGADVSMSDIEGKTMMHHLCAERRPSLLKMVLDRCPTAQASAVTQDKDGDTPLLTSFRNNTVECVKILLRRTRVPSLQDRQGRSPVHHAVAMGDPGVLEDVLKIPGIDIYAKTKLGQDAFDIAVDMGTRDQSIGHILDNAASSR